MSYRTYIEDTQVFGNNEYYEKWIDFIVEQGIEVNEDGGYDGYISNVQGAVEVIEEIILKMATDRINNKWGNIFDFTHIYNEEIKARNNNDYSNDFTFRLKEIIDNGYIFMSNSFIKACGNKVVQEWSFEGKDKRSVYYKLADENVKIHVSAS